jgi:hypothetical protein
MARKSHDQSRVAHDDRQQCGPVRTRHDEGGHGDRRRHEQQRGHDPDRARDQHGRGRCHTDRGRDPPACPAQIERQRKTPRARRSDPGDGCRPGLEVDRAPRCQTASLRDQSEGQQHPHAGYNPRDPRAGFVLERVAREQETGETGVRQDQEWRHPRLPTTTPAAPVTRAPAVTIPTVATRAL